GVVYRARQSGLDRVVAIKLLLATPEMVQRFRALNEAVRQRPSGIARLYRGEARMFHAQDTGDPRDLEAALEDLEAANSMLPGHRLALALRVNAHLVAAVFFEASREEERRQDAVREAAMAAMPLPQYPNSADPRSRELFEANNQRFDNRR